MYNIPHFKAKDHQEVLDFMQANPFVTICGVDARRLSRGYTGACFINN